MKPGSRGHLRLDVVDDITIVYFEDEEISDPSAVREVGEELYSLVEHGNHRRLLLNFENVGFMVTEMLGKLLALKKKVEKINGELKLCCLAPLVSEAFTVSGLNKVFDIFEEESLAFDSF